MRKFATVAALTLAITSGFTHRAEAQPAPGPVPPSAPVGAGPWIVGGIGLSALSVITRAAVVGNRQHRELTSAEAIDAIALPFFWVFQQGDVRRPYIIGGLWNASDKPNPRPSDWVSPIFSFQQGDVKYPYVIGGLWNTGDSGTEEKMAIKFARYKMQYQKQRPNSSTSTTAPKF